MYDILNEVINKLYDRRYQHKDIAESTSIDASTLYRIRSSPTTGYSPKHETLVKIKAYFDSLNHLNKDEIRKNKDQISENKDVQ